MTIFGKNFGQVVGVEVDRGLPALLTVSDLPSNSIIVTGFGLGQDVNVQFLETLKNQIFVYVFGDKVGKAKLHGMLFWNSCKNSGNSGVTALVNYYNSKALSQTRTPVKIAFAGGSSSSQTISAYIIGFEITSEDPQKGYIFFTLSLITAPLQSSQAG